MPRALVESVPIVLTRQCLRLPPRPNLADPSRPWRVALWSGSQLRFHLNVAGDGVPVALSIPPQPVCFNPPRWIPPQTIPIAHDFIPHPTGLRRRPWFRCPACQRPCTRLYLPDDEGRFACRLCFNLEYRSHSSIHWRVYRAAVQAGPSLSIPPSLSINQRIRALAVWYRWRTEGKGRKRSWRGKEQGAKPSAAHPFPKRRGRPKAMNDWEIGFLMGRVMRGIPREQIMQEYCGFVSRQTLNKWVIENLPLCDGFG